MNISAVLNTFSAPCICGRTHTPVTDTVEIGRDANEKLLAFLQSRGFSRVLILADTNTADAAGSRLSALTGASMLVIPGTSHATETVCAQVQKDIRSRFPSEPPDCLIACGSGSLHDIVRYTACEAQTPFLSYPTAASVDGFVSGIAAMTIRGTKVSYPSEPPIALFADPAVFAHAPARLTASGVGDLVGKYICLADWQIARLLTGEYLCPALVRLEYDVLAQLRQVIASRGNGTEEDFAMRVMEGLVLSGLAIQLCGNSRPASGAEHHLSHFWEMHCIQPETDALHGEQVGLASLLLLDVYRKAKETFASPFLYRPEKIYDTSVLSPVFGERLPAILRENLPSGTWDSSSLAQIPSDAPVRREKEIRAVLDALPRKEDLLSLMQACGCKCTFSSANLPDSDAFLCSSLRFAPYVRSRLTFLKYLNARF